VREEQIEELSRQLAQGSLTMDGDTLAQKLRQGR
jgi:anti-sigma28 factor (negative regulator of flagellin synthesis)